MSGAGFFAPSIAHPREISEHLSMLLKELANSGIRLPEIGFGTWNYRGGLQALRAAIECGARLIDTAESYGTEEIVGEAIKGRRHQVFLATKALSRNFRRHDLIAAAERASGDCAQIISISISSTGPTSQFPSKSQCGGWRNS